MLGRRKGQRPLRDELMLGELARLPTLHARSIGYARRVLRLVGGDVTKAARVLGVGRASLYRLLGELAVETKGERQRRETAAEHKRIEEAERLAWAGREFKTL